MTRVKQLPSKIVQIDGWHVLCEDGSCWQMSDPNQPLIWKLIHPPHEPPQPQAPEAVWYDEPPFAKDGESYPCWVEGEEHPVLVAMYVRWEYRANDDDGCWLPLAGRRVCPITKPQEPTT